MRNYHLQPSSMTKASTARRATVATMGARFSRATRTTPPTPTPLTPTPPALVVATPIVIGSEVKPQEGVATGHGKELLQQLDLVFTMDCTGSMGKYIRAAKSNIEAIAAKLVNSEGYDLRFALVAYRDHPPQDQTYVTKTFAFTNCVEQMKRDLETLSAQGGGDGPEAVAAGLQATLESAWRPNATKVCVLIADAPPHGLGEPGDGFPDGAPDGVDPFAVLTAMSMRGISIYSVGCEPALSNYEYAKDFFVAAAQRTNGQAVSLRSAAALADVIMGGAIEEMDLQQLADEVVEEVRKMRDARAAGGGAEDGGGYDSEEERATAWQSIQARGHTTRHMQTKKLKSKSADLVRNVLSLSEARDTLKSRGPAASAAGPVGCHAAAARRKRCGARRPEAFLRSASPTFDDLAGDVMAGAILRRRMSGSDDGWGSECSSDGEEEGAPKGSVHLETRALSFSQMSRIYGKQKTMGTI